MGKLLTAQCKMFGKFRRLLYTTTPQSGLSGEGGRVWRSHLDCYVKFKCYNQNYGEQLIVREPPEMGRLTVPHKIPHGARIGRKTGKNEAKIFNFLAN